MSTNQTNKFWKLMNEYGYAIVSGDKDRISRTKATLREFKVKHGIIAI